jgi:lysophospholipase L1-like esterase
MRTSARLVALALASALALAGACSSGSASAPAHTVPSPSAPPTVYAALGASETAGVGTSDPTRDSFPEQFYLHLPRNAVYYNFGLPGETTAAALKDELPAALAVQPTLATVWFNVDDLAAGVSVSDFESQLDQIVGPLTRGGAARVLIANTPPLDGLPAYEACRPNPPPGPKCALGAVTLPAPEQARALVDAYNASIARVAARHGAVVVDLASQAAASLAQHPDYLSSDGLHPSSKGAAAIAGAFTAAL